MKGQMKSTYNIIIISFLAVVLTACTKPEKPYHQLDKSLSAFFDFKDDSYWIYQESISGRTDSFWVSNYMHWRWSSNSADNDEERMSLSIKQFPLMPGLDSFDWGLATVYYGKRYE